MKIRIVIGVLVAVGLLGLALPILPRFAATDRRLGKQDGGSSVGGSPVLFDNVQVLVGKAAYRSGSASHVFKFRNQAHIPVSIRAVITSCGCVATEYSQKPVEPGQEGWVRLDMTSSAMNRLGRVTQRGTVFFNEFPSEKVELTTTVQVVQAVTLEPWVVDFGNIDPEAENHRRVRLKNELDQPVTVTDVSVAKNAFDVDLAVQEIKPGATVDLGVKLHKIDMDGRLADVISLKTNSPLIGTVTIPVSAVACRDGMVVSPTAITLGVVPNSSKISRTIQIQNIAHRPFTLLRVSNRDVPAHVERTDGSGGSQEVRITWDLGSFRSDREIEDRIELEYMIDGHRGVLSIPLSAFVTYDR